MDSNVNVMPTTPSDIFFEKLPENDEAYRMICEYENKLMSASVAIPGIPAGAGVICSFLELRL